MRAVLAAAMVFLAGCMGPLGDGAGPERSTIDIQCVEDPFTVPPLEPDALQGITPLGNVHPPDHTLPTVHTYWEPDGPQELRAPGDLVLHTVQTTTYQRDGSQDHGLRFTVCDGLHGYFLHLKGLDPKIEGALAEDCDSKNQTPDGEYTYCDRQAGLQVDAGDVLGEVRPHNFDFGLRDERETLDFANPDRYTGDWVHTVCPLDYFVPDVQETLRAALHHPDASCGSVMQDIPGTLAGAWFHGQDANAEEPRFWDKQLVFITDNTDPGVRIIGVGGVFMDASLWRFQPQTTGTMNRDFVDVLPDGAVHCYEVDPGQDSRGTTEGRIVLRMVDEATLEVEHQDGSCDADVALASPTEYQR